jgi:uncharacterized membrane protein
VLNQLVGRRHRLDDGTVVPLLASDSLRQIVASVVGVLTAAVLVVATSIRTGIAIGGADSGVELSARSMTPLLWMMTVYGTTYVVLTFAVLRRARGRRLREWLLAVDPRRNRRERVLATLSGGGSFAYAVSVSVFAIAAVLMLALRPDFAAYRWTWLGAIGTVAGCWCALMCTFSVRYAQLWANRQGIGFAGRGRRALSDFVYLGVQVSTTFSVGDVRLTSTIGRRVVIAHALLAFVFNSIIVALLVSAIVG